MTIILNILIILIVGAIAYWWANQGLFSAMLHLLCVVAAGAVALALFEPITVGFLLRGIWFDDYAWGVALIMVYTIALLIFRVASDRIVRGNINVPQWANFAFGLPVGAAAGVITMGIFFMGAGMMQSHKQIMSYEGYGRSLRTGAVEYLGPAIWLPAHVWTNELYNYLSVGSLYPTFSDTPLAQHYPDLYRQATLLRDSFGDGKGKLSLAPDGASVRAVYYDPDTYRHVVVVEFAAIARDFGEQLTLSRSQVRLIAAPPNDSTRRAVAVHPDAWSQQTGAAPGMHRFRFDSSTYYITSVPGAERAPVFIEFPGPAARGIPSGYIARYIQIRGTRFELPRAEEAPPGVVPVDPEDLLGQTVVLGAGPDINRFLRIDNSISPVHASKNQPLGTLRLVGNYLSEGQHRFSGRGDRPSPSLRIEGIFEPSGTRVVQLQMRADQPHNIFQRDIRQRAPANARIALVDDAGNAYSPIGFIHEGREGFTVHLDPARFLPTIDRFPILPDGGTDTLRLLFRVTEGVRIRGFVYGDLTMGLCDLDVSGPGQRF